MRESIVNGQANNTDWWNSPSFLNTEDEKWPLNVFNVPYDAISQLKAATQDTVSFSSQTVSRVIDPNRFFNIFQSERLGLLISN